MGHGAVEYGGGMMVSSNESIARHIGLKLRELAASPHFSAVLPVADLWMSELEMPPGCSSIHLDTALADPSIKALFVEALTHVHGAATDDQPLLKDQIRQVLLLLTVGEHALEGIYRPVHQAKPVLQADAPSARGLS